MLEPQQSYGERRAWIFMAIATRFSTNSDVSNIIVAADLHAEDVRQDWLYFPFCILGMLSYHLH